MYHSLYIMEWVIGTLALIFNIILIFLATRIISKGNDIKLTIALATSEVLILISLQPEFIYYIIQGTFLPAEQVGCQILGYLQSFCFYFQVMFNIMLAVERYHKILQKRVHKYFFFPLYINTIFFFCILIWMSYNGLLGPAPGGLVCIPLIDKNIFSAVIYFYFICGFIVRMIITLIYYFKLAKIINHFQKIKNQRLKEDSRTCKWIRFGNFGKARLKLYIIIGVYGLLMFVTAILLMVVGILIHLNKSASVELINQFVGLFSISGLLANPIIMLSIHTGIIDELKKLIARLRH